MTNKTVQSLSGKWTFETYENSENVQSEKPTIMLIVMPLPNNNNSKFPYKILGVYQTDNPNSLLNNNPPFIINNGEEILLLKHDYSDTENQLLSDLIKMKKETNAPTYNKLGNEI